MQLIMPRLEHQLAETAAQLQTIQRLRKRSQAVNPSRHISVVILHHAKSNLYPESSARI